MSGLSVAAALASVGTALASPAPPSSFRKSRRSTDIQPQVEGFITRINAKPGQKVKRGVIIGYVEDGPNLVALAMNGWDEGHPSWWLNLEEHPDAVVRLARQHPRPVRARPSVGEERDRLWQRWVAVDPKLDAYAGRRSTETPVIVLEPRDGAA